MPARGSRCQTTRPWTSSSSAPGAIGAATAWRCAQRGLDGHRRRPGPARGAWHTAAGMLAPITELHYTETPLLRAEPGLARALPGLRRRAGRGAGLPDRLPARRGTVAVAWDAADLAALRDLHAFATALGVRRPNSSPGASCARSNRPSRPACPAACSRPATTRSTRGCCTPRCSRRGRRRGVRGGVDGHGARRRRPRRRRRGCADGAPIAAGHGRARGRLLVGAVDGVPGRAVPPVRPVKGQTLRLRLPGPPRLRPRRARRGQGHRRSTSCRAPTAGSWSAPAPRRPASTARPGPGRSTSCCATRSRCCPSSARPCSRRSAPGCARARPDNAPLIGRVRRCRASCYATGHYRNGILLTPGDRRRSRRT